MEDLNRMREFVQEKTTEEGLLDKFRKLAILYAENLDPERPDFPFSAEKVEIKNGVVYVEVLFSYPRDDAKVTRETVALPKGLFAEEKIIGHAREIARKRFLRAIRSGIGAIYRRYVGDNLWVLDVLKEDERKLLEHLMEKK